MTIQEFVKTNNISIELKKISRNPNMDNGDWEENAKHWEVTLNMPARDWNGKYQRPTLITYFSQGSGLKNRPTTKDVLDCLASDASTTEDYTFDEWIQDYGYDNEPMSKYPQYKATYEVILKQSKELKQFLGEDQYKVLLEEVERL